MSEDYAIEISSGIDVRVSLPRMSPFKYSIAECEAFGGARDAIPRAWAAGETDSLRLLVPPMVIDVLHKPYVFGGHIREKAGKRHLDRQLVLDQSMQIGAYSYGIMDGTPSLPRELCADDDDVFVGTIEDTTPLGGDFLFLGTAHIHFGHLVVEGLSRLWGLSHLAAQINEPHFLIYETVLRDFAFELLDLAGVSRARLIGSPPLAIPDRLFVPSPSMRTHHWISDQQSAVWDRIGAEANERMQPFTGPRKVFLSRSGVANRCLKNEKEVEQIFAEHGFVIINPETMPITWQIKIAYDADVLAGCVGSQMYLAAFQKQERRNIILAPENFFTKDDLLIAHAKRHGLAVFFGSLTDRFHNEGWHVDTNAMIGFLAEEMRS